MIGSIITANRTLLSKIFCQSERLFSCTLRSTTNVYLQKKPLYCKSASNQVLLPSPLSYEPRRQYSIGEYDKLWQSVTSGTSARGRRVNKNPDGDFIKFGKAGKSWPGLNSPIDPQTGREPQQMDKNKQTGKFKKSRKIHRELRGWVGTSWAGRKVGAPKAPNGEDVEGFSSMVMDVRKVSTTKASGRRRTTSALVVVGNKKGAIGWAIGKGPLPVNAIMQARNKAVNYLHYIPICDGHTIYHDLNTKVRNTTIKFERKVPGYGIRAQRIVRSIAELAGIKDIRCKIIGATTPLTVTVCTIQGFVIQESHQDLAERTGKNVVEYRPEQGNRPVVVAIPSERAIKRMMEGQSEKRNPRERDPPEGLDSYRGVHRPKSLSQVRRIGDDLLARAELQ